MLVASKVKMSSSVKENEQEHMQQNLENIRHHFPPSNM